MRTKTKILWAIAFAMIFLIVTLPFYISDAYAQADVSKVNRMVYPTPSGAANVQGFAMSTDVLTIIANVRASGASDADAASHVIANFGGGDEQFASCSPLNLSWYDCTFQKELIELPGGRYSGQIKLVNVSSCVGCTATVSFNVDQFAPEFSQFSVSPQKTNQQNITVSYSAIDRACDGCGLGICSGIKNVVIYSSSDFANALATIFVNQSPNSPSSCADIRTLNVPVSSLSSGNYTICIAASDNVGNMNVTPNKCANLVIARDAPVISDVAIVDSTGNIFTYMPLAGVMATFSANITAEFADITKAIVDLSAFQLSNQTMSCSRAEESRTWNCKSQFYALITADTTTETVPVYAYDDAGNIIRADFAFGLQQDNTRPELNSFKTNYMYKNYTFFGPSNNMISIEISEAQSGFYKNMTYIRGLGNYFDVQQFGPSTLYQGQCTGAAGIWTCSWPQLSLTSSEESANLGFEVYDDVSNHLQFSENVFIDNQPPKVVDVEVHTQNTYPAIGAGDNVVVRANITDRSAIVDSSANYNVSMDLTLFEGGTEARKADSCELVNESIVGGVYEGSNWICSWIVNGAIEVTGWVPRINISDITGNIQEDVSDFQKYLVYVNAKTGNTTFLPVTAFDVLPRENESKDYWKVDAGESMPSVLDRQMLNVVGSFAYVPLIFTPLEDSPQVLEVTLESCDNDGTASEINIFPNVPNSSDIELFVLNGNYAKETYLLQYPCRIGTVSIANGKLTQKEVDNVTVKIGLYNMPLGQFDKEVKKKVDWIHDLALTDLAKILGVLKQVLDWLKLICNLYSVVSEIILLVRWAMHHFSLSAEACAASGILAPVCAPAAFTAKTQSVALQAGHVTLSSVANGFCKAMSCSFGKFFENYQKIQNLGSQKAGDWSRKVLGKGPMGDAVMGVSGNMLQFWPPIQESLVLSIIFICVPGVVYNLEKYRQLLCNYGLCTLQMAASGGPLKGCDEMYKTQVCLAVVGEIFNIIPFGTIFSNLGDFLQTVFHDPFSLVFFGVGVGCELIPSASATHFCEITNVVTNVLNFIAQIMSAYSDVTSKINEGKSAFTTNDICKSFEKAYKDMKV